MCCYLRWLSRSHSCTAVIRIPTITGQETSIRGPATAPDECRQIFEKASLGGFHASISDTYCADQANGDGDCDEYTAGRQHGPCVFQSVDFGVPRARGQDRAAAGPPPTYLFPVKRKFSYPAFCFLAIYTKITKDDIRRNRENSSERLGFLGRIVHGNPKAWLKKTLQRLGDERVRLDDGKSSYGCC